MTAPGSPFKIQWDKLACSPLTSSTPSACFVKCRKCLASKYNLDSRCNSRSVRTVDELVNLCWKVDPDVVSLQLPKPFPVGLVCMEYVHVGILSNRKETLPRGWARGSRPTQTQHKLRCVPASVRVCVLGGEGSREKQPER